MGLHSSQSHSGLTTHGPTPGPGLRPLAGPCQPSTASACTTRSRHVWPWPERARWRAHHWFNDGKDPKLTEGKWSLDLGLHAATRKPRRGGQERGAHRRRCYCSSVRAVGEEMLVRGQRSGRGGGTSGWGGAPWRRRAHYGVNRAGERSEKAATGKVLTEEDDGGGNPMAQLG
jgi:hypothetical protein